MSASNAIARAMVSATVSHNPEGVAFMCELCAKCVALVDGGEADVFAVEELIEHAAFEHATSAGLLVSRVTGLIRPYELRLLLGATPATEHEEKWRERQG